jgi:glyoxylase-like metal-dependent hydrolase (beta-lactamase superfamily II)
MSDYLSVSVFNSGYKNIPGGPGWDPGTQATWPASTSTLIAGDQDAILVDALLTTSEGQRLADWVKNSRKAPSLIFLTHGHGDHYFGAGPTLSTFPQAKLAVLDSRTVAEAADQLTPEILRVWDSWFGGQYDREPAMPTVLTSGGDVEIEGHPVHMRTVGGADDPGYEGSIVYVPELSTICSGDVVYNNIHMWLYQSTPETRATWLASIDAIAAMEPRTIICGHSDPDAPDNDAQRCIAQSRTYIMDFDRAAETSSSMSELMDKMMAKYSSYGNAYTLFAAAASQFPS